MDMYTVSPLEKAFKFTEQDMRDNRQGRLSASQAARFRGQARRLMFLVLGALAAFTVPSLLLVGSSPNELFAVLSCVLLPIIGVTFAVTIAPAEAAVGPGVVSKASGRVHKAYGLMDFEPPLTMDTTNPLGQARMMGRTGNPGSYRIVIGNRMFRVGQEEYEALTPGFYTVYYLPTINKIVSAVRMDPELEDDAVKPAKPELVITVAPQRDDSEEVKG